MQKVQLTYPSKSKYLTTKEAVEAVASLQPVTTNTASNADAVAA